MQTVAQNTTVDMLVAEEIEQLRSRFPETQDLYKEVCVLLFFRHGITPTANKLYQLVRKGSMSAPAEALARFWENLREKSRIRIAHPDLPPELAETAGELIAALWQRAQSSARASFDQTIEEARSAIGQAQVQAATELARAQAAAHALFQLQSEFSTNLTQLQDLENRLAREQGACTGLEKQLAAAALQQRELQEALAAARKDYAAQLDQQRASQQLAEQAHATELRAAQLGAASERSRADATRGALEEGQRRATALTQQHVADSHTLQQQIAQLRQELGSAAGALAESRAAREVLRRQMERALGPARDGGLRRKGRISGRV